MTADSTVLQDALSESGQRHGPGLFGLVTEGGKVIFAGSAGVADISHPRPLDVHDQFRIGSVTKTYVAAVVLQLVSENVLSLTDSVHRWLGDIVPGSEAMTVEMLLRLRSGLPDYIGPMLGDPPDLRVFEHYRSPEQLIRLALSGPDLLPPDTTFRYSNTDYILLGLMVEKATGQRIDAQLWQRIFKPLNLDDTTFPTVDRHLRGQHALGYLRVMPDSAYIECSTLSPSQGWTAGAIIATAADVATFLDGLFDGSLLDPDALARMTDCTQVLDDHCARGMGIVRYDFGVGNVAYGHQGGVPGFTTVALRSTTSRCVILCQNASDLHDELPAKTPFVLAALSA